MKLWCVLIVSVLLLLPASGQGQESLSLTLTEALGLMQEHNPDLLAARQELEIAQGRLLKARYPTQSNPVIGGDVAHRSRGEPGEQGSTTDFSIGLSQEVEVGGQRGKRIEEAERNLEKVSQQVRDAERRLTAQVKDAFYQALYRKQRLDLFRQVEDLNGRLLTGSVAAGLFAVSVGVALFMGAEFIPRLDEGTLAVQAWRLPSVSLEESVRNTTMIERVLKRFPEVVTVVSRTGRAEIATDPMGVETSDIYVILKPHEEWQTAQTREGLITALNGALTSAVPGVVFSYSQPIELRVQELIAGVRSDVAITIFGEDLDTLTDLGDRVVQVVSLVPGAADTKAEQVSGVPYMRIIINREAIARYGINASQILDTISTMGGRLVGEVFEGQRRFFMQVRFAAEDRQDFDRIKEVPVADPSGRLIPLSQLTEIRIEPGPTQISRDKIHRRLAVETNVRGRDLASFVVEAQRTVASQVKLPPGYWIEWGGQFENLQRASARLAIVVPLALFLIFVLLYSTFGAATPALLIYLNVPLAATGGIFALALRGMPFSISAGVGFIALFGVAVLNGVVLMSYILRMQHEGLSGAEAAQRGAEIRLRPVLMTALVASLGFVPMALSTSAGAEVQQPLATVVIGGLITSTVLTLLVLPSLYAWIERRRTATAQSKEGAGAV